MLSGETLRTLQAGLSSPFKSLAIKDNFVSVRLEFDDQCTISGRPCTCRPEKLLLRKANQYARVAKPWRLPVPAEKTPFGAGGRTPGHAIPGHMSVRQCWQNSQPIYWTSSFGWCSTRFKLWAPSQNTYAGISNAISISTTSAWLPQPTVLWKCRLVT